MEQHLEEVSSTPFTRIDIGTIQRQKGPLQTILVALTIYDDRDKFLFPGGNIRRWRNSGWMVLCESSDKNTFLSYATTKERAIVYALKHLDTAERRGSLVVRDNLAESVPRRENTNGIVGALLAADPEGLPEISVLVDAIDEILNVVPLLEQRKALLQQKQLDSILALMD